MTTSHRPSPHPRSVHEGIGVVNDTPGARVHVTYIGQGDGNETKCRPGGGLRTTRVLRPVDGDDHEALLAALTEAEVNPDRMCRRCFANHVIDPYRTRWHARHDRPTVAVYRTTEPLSALYHPRCIVAAVAADNRYLPTTRRGQTLGADMSTEDALTRLAEAAGIDRDSSVMPTVHHLSQAELVHANGLPQLCGSCLRSLHPALPTVHLFPASLNAVTAVGAQPAQVQDSDVLIACDEHITGVVTHLTPRALTADHGAFEPHLDWATELHGRYDTTARYALSVVGAPLTPPAPDRSSTTRTSSYGACVWCLARHRDPIAVHPYARQALADALGPAADNASCAEVFAWLRDQHQQVTATDGTVLGYIWYGPVQRPYFTGHNHVWFSRSVHADPAPAQGIWGQQDHADQQQAEWLLAVLHRLQQRRDTDAAILADTARLVARHGERMVAMEGLDGIALPALVRPTPTGPVPVMRRKVVEVFMAAVNKDAFGQRGCDMMVADWDGDTLMVIGTGQLLDDPASELDDPASEGGAVHRAHPDQRGGYDMTLGGLPWYELGTAPAQHIS
jgi:hypothetical protein